VPVASSLAKTEEARQLINAGIIVPTAISRLYALPPGTPADRLQALRAAFLETLRDPEFTADATRAKLEVDPIGGEETDRLVQDPRRADDRLDDRRRPSHGQERRGRAGARGRDHEPALRRGVRRFRPRPGHPGRAAAGADVWLPRVLHARGPRHHLRGFAERRGTLERAPGRLPRSLVRDDRARPGVGDPALHLRPALPLGRDRA